MLEKELKRIGRFCSRDVIALVTIIGGLILIGLGIDKIVGGLLVMIVSFYFGLNTPKVKE